MHDSDTLSIILQSIKQNLPGVPDETWGMLERSLRDDLGGRDHFIARRAKGGLLNALESALADDANATNSLLSQRLGVSISRVQQLKRLIRPANR